MFNAKRVAVMAVALAVTVPLAACGSSASGSDEETITIGVSFYDQALPIYTEMLKGLEAEAKVKGVELVVNDASNSAQTQTNQINNLVTRNVDAIIGAPQDASALVPAYKSVMQAKIPIFSAGTNIKDPSAQTGYIGPDLAAEATDEMGKVIDALGGSGEIALVTGPPVSSLVQLQQKGWNAALAKAPGIKVVNTVVVPDMSKAGTIDPVTSLLTAHPEIKAVVASNDQVALGVVQAMHSLNKADGSIFIACFNTPPDIVAALKANQIQVAISQKAQTWGRTALDTVYDQIKGKKAAPFTPTKYLLVTNQTVASVGPADLD